ncbi:MAG TPA: deoxyribonuclease IV [Candidatus Limnocylindrales bacterium]|nr:deoxyribonuclease IV [Candidatus Limnocylindrales bacterium]
MPPDERRIGAHLPLGFGMVKAVERAHTIGANAIQVFSDNPTAWRRRADPPKELPAFRARLDELAIAPVAIHASYLVNLAGPEEAFYSRSIGVLASDLRAAPGFRARFVNVHVGSHRGSGPATGTQRLAEGLRLVLAEADGGLDGAMVVLENSAGGGFGLGIDVAELTAIANAASALGIPDGRLGFCLDTAHAWGAGIDLSHAEGVDAFLDEFESRIGLGRLAMIHLNDSKSERGSRLDRHEHVGAGRIGAEGLRHLLRHPRLAHVAYYLETPGMDEGYDAINMARVRDLLAGRPLAELPPEAMALRGSRARTAPADDAAEAQEA